MKNSTVLFIGLLMAGRLCAQIEMSVNSHNMPVRFTQEVVAINGENVNGSPFLYLNWNEGKLKTPDGREYALKYKYDVYHQSVHFYDGKDSMEINEPVASFALLIEEGDKQKIWHNFQQSNDFGKSKNKGYYEVVKESNHSVLLKYYTMQVVSLNYNVGGAIGRKSLNLTCSYWLYLKDSKKLIDLKDNFKTILSNSQVSAERRVAIDAQVFNYEAETDAVKLMAELDKP